MMVQEIINNNVMANAVEMVRVMIAACVMVIMLIKTVKEFVLVML